MSEADWRGYVRAVQIVRFDDTDGVEVRDVPEPVRGPDQVLVDVSDVALNFTDVLACRGKLQHTPALPFTLGTERAGTVRAAPQDAAVAPGDRVAVGSRLERPSARWSSTLADRPRMSTAAPCGATARMRAHSVHADFSSLQ
jgi:NADPH:quinone reductase-like Zn-dependent oxidoreductase